MRQYETFVEITNRFKAQAKSVFWTEEQIEKEHGKRTLGQILETMEFPPMTCFDRALVIGYQAMQIGISVNLAMMSISKPFKGLRLRMALEPILDGKYYVFHPGEKGDIIREGSMPYKFIHRLLRPKIIRVPLFSDLNKSWFNQFGLNSPEELENQFNGFSYDQYIRLVKRANRIKQQAQPQVQPLLSLP